MELLEIPQPCLTLSVSLGLYPAQGRLLEEHLLLSLNKRQCGQNSTCQSAGLQSVWCLCWDGNGMEGETDQLC